MRSDLKISGDWLRHGATQAVCAALSSQRFQALFVGGCVRNALLGAPVSDIDIATNAHPHQVLDCAKQAGLKAVPTGIDHGTVTILSEGIPHEVTTFRKDVETDGRRAVVAFADTIEQDALRRDFTMNALYAEADGTVIDPLGGISDLDDRYVRFIQDPAQRIREDYLRILRFFRFNAWYADPTLGYDPEALAAIADLFEGMKTLSKERITSEMSKLFSAPVAFSAISVMSQVGVLQYLLPGATPKALGLLEHFEASMSVAPSPMRRLASLGLDLEIDRLRLSKKQLTTLDLLRTALKGDMPVTECAYFHGPEHANDVLLLRAAFMETPPNPSDIDVIATAATARFPITASDLMSQLTGRALGEALKRLERQWLDSDMQLTKTELLKRV